ncbi:hypothetical protein QR680_002858 [Steinernema hermaphroditum]|uniref:Nucleotidyl transferase domain-containing protein n=1 Tax=Steinernema hermaphroditum TaxID=289476 RepID=A0AA39H4D9_9BILA|nr:hypothetical protein QR680_002858 [Steinernema hermaphroditum]
MIDFHQKHGREGTIAVTRVGEPSKYGVVVFDENTGRIGRFLEKPQEYGGNKINAGIYVLSPSIFERIHKPTSIEKVIFPVMAGCNNLYAYVLPGFWMDARAFTYVIFARVTKLASGDYIHSDVVVDETAHVGEKRVIGLNVVIGARVRIEDGVCLRNCTVLPDSVIRTHSSLGQNREYECIDDDVAIKEEFYLNRAIVLPRKSISENVPDPHIIM